VAGHRVSFTARARWAVFFDALGLEFAYEPERYYFDGLDYVPDFFLPGVPCFVEIKSAGTISPITERLVGGLAKQMRTESILIVGEPVPEPGRHAITVFNGGEMSDWFAWNAFTDCRDCEGICLAELQVDGRETSVAQSYDLGKHSSDEHDRWNCPPQSDYGVGRAYVTARDAVFT
jgi:hypothetical protein